MTRKPKSREADGESQSGERPKAKAARRGRHVFTTADRILAAERALENPKTPKQLLPAIRRRLRKLRGQSQRGRMDVCAHLANFFRG